MNVWKEAIELLLNLQLFSLKEEAKIQESFKIWLLWNVNETESNIDVN